MVERRLPALHPRHGVALALERAHEREGDVGFVLYDQNVMRHGVEHRADRLRPGAHQRSLSFAPDSVAAEVEQARPAGVLAAADGNHRIAPSVEAVRMAESSGVPRVIVTTVTCTPATVAVVRGHRRAGERRRLVVLDVVLDERDVPEVGVGLDPVAAGAGAVDALVLHADA